METFIKIGRAFYGICMMVIGINQIVFGDFRPAILPPWPHWRTADPLFAACFFGIVLIYAGIAIIFTKQGKNVALILGSILLALAVFWQLPYILFIQPHKIRHLGLWADASKTLALSGGAFVVAGSFLSFKEQKFKSVFFTIQEKLIPYGRIFFSITMIEFGLDHIYYIDNISTMVPDWIPWHIFWTYLSALALISAGIAIIVKIKIKLAAQLLSIIIFIWFLILHIPDAISHPTLFNGNAIVSAADALGFSGTALLIAINEEYQKNAKQI